MSSYVGTIGDGPAHELIIYMYRIPSSKRTWAHEIDSQITGWMLTHTSHLYATTCVYENHRFIKKGVWALTRRLALTRENKVVGLGTCINTP